MFLPNFHVAVVARVMYHHEGVFLLAGLPVSTMSSQKRRTKLQFTLRKTALFRVLGILAA